ncbi:hypothetical protein HGRIS_008683 [Hohenbuehelia grisea]|uniref:Homeobox domain-containing protein n=1 Tax=Hohenbuehelia grisea TaxID=104357 RepID=A0ABR3J915_9AGAR
MVATAYKSTEPFTLLAQPPPTTTTTSTPPMSTRTMPPTLSRTPSATSISSADTELVTPDTSLSNLDANPNPNAVSARRTRRRFTNPQLAMLERLYRINSHPSRVEREALAKEGGMENRSVTIWFQNKRQTERRVALHNATSYNHQNSTSGSSRVRRGSPSLASVSSLDSRYSRLSLDRVASLSELRVPAPRTPTRRPRDPDANVDLWDIMPSSPVAQMASPPPRDYVEFGRGQRKRTLEWACAAARLADKEGTRSRRHEEHDENYDYNRSRRRGRDIYSAACRSVDTDDEVHEALTPPSATLGADRRWVTESGRQQPKPVLQAVQDEDMMAALTLCGLGGRC